MDPTNNTLLWWVGLLALAGIVLFAISRTGRRQRDSRTDHYRTALNQLIHNDRDGALESLRLALQAGNAPPDAYIKLGNLLRGRGEAVAAFQIHQSLTVRQDLHPDERAANLRSLVEDYRALGQPSEALRTLESLAELGRDSTVLGELARESVHAGQYETALSSIRALQRLDGAIGKPEIAAFQAVIAARCLQKGDTEDAKRFLRQAIKDDAHCPQALLLMGDVASQEGDSESALYYWQKLVFAGAADGPEVHEKLEKVYFELGKFTEIERVYHQILEKHPQDLQTHLASARIALKKGEPVDAERLLRRTLEIDPRSSEAFLRLAHLLLDEGKTDETRDLIGAHAKLHGEDRTFRCSGCKQESEQRPGYCVHCGRFASYSLA